MALRTISEEYLSGLVSVYDPWWGLRALSWPRGSREQRDYLAGRAVAQGDMGAQREGWEPRWWPEAMAGELREPGCLLTERGGG